MKKIISMAAALGVCAAMPALANMEKDMHDKGDHYFMKMDTNKDGRISKGEHDTFARKMFGKTDTNNDNMLSREEMMAHMRMEMDKHHRGYDRMSGTRTYDNRGYDTTELLENTSTDVAPGARDNLSPAAGGSHPDMMNTRTKPEMINTNPARDWDNRRRY